MQTKVETEERFFSVELKSKAHLKNVTRANGSRDNVLIEGSIGELLKATFADGIIIEVVGKKGILRINLEEHEIKKTTTENQSKGKNQ